MTEYSDEGRGILTILLIVFIVLKLAGLVSWPWVWVLAPLWIPFVVFGIAYLILREVLKRRYR
jgi:hypothetical protein